MLKISKIYLKKPVFSSFRYFCSSEIAKKTTLEPSAIVINPEDNILVRQKKEREKVVELTEYLKTRKITEVSAEERQLIVQRIRETLPKRRGIIDAIKPYVKDLSQLTEEERKSIIFGFSQHIDLLQTMDLTLKELQALQDEDYYVDLREEVQKDLYEKQRVVDQFLIENEEERKDLLGYYENLYHKAEPNMYDHIIYANSIDLARVRAALSIGMFTTVTSTILLSFVHPLLPLIMVYDYYKIYTYMKILNRLIIRMMINKTKTKVFVETTNFLGYWKKPRMKWLKIKDFKYLKKVKNIGLNPNNIGGLPSYIALKSFFFKNVIKTEDTKRHEKKVNMTGAKFVEFHKFIHNNVPYYIPTDLVDKSKSILDEELLLSIMHGDQMNVYNHDFKSHDEELLISIEESKEAIQDAEYFDHLNLFGEEYRKKRDFMKYQPNRDYENRYGNEQLKNPMGDDGTYTNNGYR